MSLNPRGLRARAKALAATRNWFAQQGYLEVPTPVLVPSPAMEATLFAPRVGDRYLRTSPEFALKRALAAGLGRIYEIGPCFRERESGPWHGREFTMLEWYRAGASLSDLMTEVASLVRDCADALEVAAPTEWETISVQDLFLRETGIDLAEASPEDISNGRDSAWDDAFFRRWIEDVEPSLKHPCFVTEWPASQAALAQIRSDKQWPTAQRFEVFLNGVELGNAFLELLDPAEQRRRFIQENLLRTQSGELPHPIDEAFIEAVGRMPPTAGIAVGFDRLVASLCGWDGIDAGRVAHPSDR